MQALSSISELRLQKAFGRSVMPAGDRQPIKIIDGMTPVMIRAGRSVETVHGAVANGNHPDRLGGERPVLVWIDPADVASLRADGAIF